VEPGRSAARTRSGRRRRSRRLAERILERYFSGDVSVGRERRVSSVDDRVTDAARAGGTRE
jgi:hypothetical protein